MSVENPSSSLQPVQPEHEDPVALLSRQVDEIAAKRADVLAQLISETDEVKKVKLRELADTLEKEHERRFKEYTEKFPEWKSAA